LCVPLKVKSELIGVIYTDNRIRSRIFSEEDRDLLTAIANQAAVAIKAKMEAEEEHIATENVEAEQKAKQESARLLAERKAEKELNLRAEQQEEPANRNKVSVESDQRLASALSRTYRISSKYMSAIAEEISHYFLGHEFEAKIIPQGNNLLIQGNMLKMYLGATVLIESLDPELKVSISGRSLINKVVTGAFYRLMDLGGSGSTEVFMEKKEQDLINNLWGVIENMVIKFGGERID